MSENGKITVFLLDDHEVVRRGVREMLTMEADIEVVGEAGTAAEALTRIPATRPDVAVLDVRLPDGSGVEVCREIRSRGKGWGGAGEGGGGGGVKCLMLTSFADDEALVDAIMAGASGYVLKEIRGTELLSAVRQVAAGRSLLDPAATQRVLERLRGGGGGGTGAGGAGAARDGALGDRPGPGHGPGHGPGRLTEQEQRILTLIGEGLTNRAIGERLHLAEKTIKNYVSGLLAKLDMERRAQVAAYVARTRAEHRR